MLEHDELGVRPLRTAKATDRFILSGGEDVFEPTFTFHGFRYVEVDGWPGELTADALAAVVVSSELQRIGEFECSDELLNQLHRNVVWGTRGNFLDVPTDCPQRDERLGWTGDIAVFAPTAAYLFDVEDFLRDWLADLAAEQRAADGMVPFVVPDVLKYIERPSHFPAPRKHRYLERRRGVGAVGAVAGVRGPAGAERPVRLDDGACSPCGIPAVAHRTVGYRIPVRRLAGPDRTAR